MKSLALAIAVGPLVVAAPAAHGYDPATTHAGLTERAVLGSGLHGVLSRSLGRPLGLLEPLQIHSRLLDPGVRQTLWARFSALDPAGGYRPGADGAAGALSWVVAGTVLAQTPPERGRHHFLEPRRRMGLADARGLAGAAHAVLLAIDDGANFRQIATGSAFDLTGRASIEWVGSPLNDQGLPAFLDGWEGAVAAALPDQREAALVRGLIALGGILAVLEDAGEPAHVRNDFRGAYLARRGPSAWDRASAFERFVAARYGRIGVPAPRATVRRPTWEAFFAAGDGRGLADRTQRRFFSPGTLPENVPIDPDTTTRDVLRAARESLEFPLPRVTGLDLKAAGQGRYLLLEGRRALGYERVQERVRFFLDEAVYADAAHVLLPEVAGYAAGLIDHLLRVRPKMEAAGRRVTVSIQGLAGALQEGRLRLFAEEREGARRELPVTSEGGPVVFEAPAGIRKVAVALRGRDSGGPFVAAGEIALP